MKFPEYFPEGCPPQNAEPESIEAYRLCKTESITRVDFYSFYELGKNIKGNINGYGVSVIGNYGEASTLSKMPTHKKEYLACGVTDPDCGVVLRTPSRNLSSHITWWLYEDATPEKYFK